MNRRRRSVNNARRARGLLELCGHLSRPVYLKPLPATFIDRRGHRRRGRRRAELSDVATSNWLGEPASACASKRRQRAGARTRRGIRPGRRPSLMSRCQRRRRSLVAVSNPMLWTAETPNLYTLELRYNQGRDVVHSIHQKFGFRTIEVRPGEGVLRQRQPHHVSRARIGIRSGRIPAGACLEKISAIDHRADERYEHEWTVRCRPLPAGPAFSRYLRRDGHLCAG